jgi:hypothetical protein
LGSRLRTMIVFPSLERVTFRSFARIGSAATRARLRLCTYPCCCSFVVSFLGILSSKLSPTSSPAAVGTGYGLFVTSNDVRNGKLTESDLIQKIMKYTGASEKSARSIARPSIKKMGTREFRSLTVIAAAGGTIVGIYEGYKASTSEAKIQGLPVKNLLPPSEDAPESTPK